MAAKKYLKTNNKNNSVASVIRNDKFEMSAVVVKCHCLCGDGMCEASYDPNS